jgi:hypothetical protein
MDEHDDDLESQVQRDAEKERDAFPETGDELDDAEEAAADEGEDEPLDEDEAEL